MDAMGRDGTSSASTILLSGKKIKKIICWNSLHLKNLTVWNFRPFCASCRVIRRGKEMKNEEMRMKKRKRDMGFELGIFEDASLDASFVEWLVERQWPAVNRYFNRLWDYYANPMTEAVQTGADSSRGYVQAQETGLPLRITGRTTGEGGDIQRKEVVIENDIGWRINAMVDFLFGRPIEIKSKAAAADRRRAIEAILKAVFDGSGGAVFFQDLAVLGSVYGFVDCIVRWGGPLARRLVTGTSLGISKVTPVPDFDSVLRLAGDIGLELIDAGRALPVLEETDYKRIRYYV
jgi:hypothetical protein